TWSQNIDYEEYYTTRDPDLLASNFTTNLAFLTNNWRHMLGRPTITLMATHYMLDQDKIPLAMIQTMRKLKSGYINGTRVMLGNLKDFLNTSAITDLSFLGSTEDGYPDRLHPDVQAYLDEHLLRSFSHRGMMKLHGGHLRPRQLRRRMSCKGAIKKTRSINVDSDNLGMEGPTPLIERRLSSVVPPPWLQSNKANNISVFDTTPEEGPPNLVIDPLIRENIYPIDPHHNRSAIERRSEFTRQQEIQAIPKILVQRHRTDTNFADTEVEELIAMLRETENLEEQGDILQYLVDTQGLDFNTAGLGLKNKDSVENSNMIAMFHIYVDQDKIPLAMIQTMRKLKSGYINGTRVMLGNLKDFLNTSAITDLSFLGSTEDGYPDRLHPDVQAYLDEHLLRSFSHRGMMKLHGGHLRPRQLRRRMSCKGAIKKTRSINVDSDNLGMEGPTPLIERRLSSVVPPPWLQSNKANNISVFDTTPEEGPPNLIIDPLIRENIYPIDPHHNRSAIERRSEFTRQQEIQAIPKILVQRHRTDTNFADTEVEELIAMLRETENLEEQGDILQYLVDTQGLDFNTGMLEEGRVVTVRDLLKGLYEKACQQKLWGLVRHTAGMLGKRVEDLAKAVTDLLVRQKQVTVGMPPNNEYTITAPLPELELRQLIHDTYGDDESTAMLTQELMVYLAMFIRTEPQLFHEMLRLRVGLIIQVMAKELSRTLNCDGEAASEHLLNLSPFEMKNLLYHILSGKEFAVSSVARGNLSIVSCKSSRVSKKSQIGLGEQEGDDAIIATIDDRQGQWLRRRRLDGALNRVPRDFYSRVWSVLEKCQGLAIEGRILQQSLTQEMTPGELKFALEVETALNQIPQPEYRQLVVEALMVLTLMTEHNMVPSLGGIIYVEHLVHKANQLFLEDQRKVQGDAMLCCAKSKEGKDQQAASGMLLCGGAAYICQHLYDSAPSGSYGTMTYMARAVALVLDCVPKHGEMECVIS
ncbi:probable phosphorylase b kinase regulatory subunit alpha, partial [Rhagoletis pomonella]|uniref:probable phosphorylase b kinase regulatory subunit alpha n=1 Tax=Rhagoletis pomonella TaxID=28610 RepID=UPI00177DBB90